MLLLFAAGCSSNDNQASQHVTAPPLLAQPSVSITPASGTGPIAPAVPIVIKATRGVLTNVAVTSPNHTLVTGVMSADKSTWTSNEKLGYGVTYQVVADAASLTGGATEQTGTVHTATPSNQTFPSLTPAPGASDSYGVGQIIAVSFDEPITDKAAAIRALQITSNPPQVGAWYWLDDQTVHYRPQNYWLPNTTITLNANIYGVNLGGGVYGQVDRSATYRIHDSWVGKADGKTEQMVIFHNGQNVRTMPISLGSSVYPSHTGPHIISDREPSVTMDSCSYGVCQGQPGYYKETVLLDERISMDGEYVHSAPWSVGQQGSSNVSHGCVNLSPDNAQWFFNTFNLGDVVEITNSGGPPLPVWDIYGDWEVPWPQWLAGNPNA